MIELLCWPLTKRLTSQHYSYFIINGYRIVQKGLLGIVNLKKKTFKMSIENIA